MSDFYKETRTGVSSAELFDWHMREAAFERLIPPWEKIRVLERVGGIRDGGKVVLGIRQGPWTHRWVAVHRDPIEGQQFIDEQIEGPFARWVHTHQFLPNGDGSSLLRDHIDYQIPFGALGSLASGPIRRKLERTFAFRHARTRQDLERLHPYASRGPLRIAVTGASGLVGKELCSFLSCGGHDVVPLVRQKGREGVFWDPVQGKIDKDALEKMDVVIHLAGENIGAGRWTARRKETIRRSRVEGTRFLADTLASLKEPPKGFLCASAIGFYGDRDDETLDEASPPGKGFLPETCRDWEEACGPARKAGLRVVNVRTGIVLSARGGALAKMLPPFLAGGGGIIGSGKQWMSWVSLEDLIGIFHHLIHSDLQGPVNATAPQPLTNHDFTKALGKVLGRPTFFPLPGPIVRALFGEMGVALLLEGQKVLPDKLASSGFRFLHPDLESALRWELGR